MAECVPNNTQYNVYIGYFINPGIEPSPTENVLVTGSLNMGTFTGTSTKGDITLSWNGFNWEIGFVNPTQVPPEAYTYPDYYDILTPTTGGTDECDPSNGNYYLSELEFPNWNWYAYVSLAFPTSTSTSTTPSPTTPSPTTPSPTSTSTSTTTRISIIPKIKNVFNSIIDNT